MESKLRPVVCVCMRENATWVMPYEELADASSKVWLLLWLDVVQSVVPVHENILTAICHIHIKLISSVFNGIFSLFLSYSVQTPQNQTGSIDHSSITCHLECPLMMLMSLQIKSGSLYHIIYSFLLLLLSFTPPGAAVFQEVERSPSNQKRKNSL